jgi:hypothetical protein
MNRKRGKCEKRRKDVNVNNERERKEKRITEISWIKYHICKRSKTKSKKAP